MVDTGASYSWVLRTRLEHLDVHPVRRMQFRTIEGKTIERDLVPVFVAADGFTQHVVGLAHTGSVAKKEFENGSLARRRSLLKPLLGSFGHRAYCR